MDAIVCRDVTKEYDGVRALEGVRLRVAQGDAFGLLGQSGAGKTTFVHLLLGFQFPTTGSVRVLGEDDPQQARPRVGYLPEQPSYEPLFSARDYLQLLGTLSDLSGHRLRQRIKQVLDLTGLTSQADRRLGALPRGALQRFGIAQALLGSPDILILDEPTAGLDPLEQQQLRRIILQLRDQGLTLFVCSSSPLEVEELCRTVGLLRQGRLVLSGPVDELLRQGDLVEIRVPALSQQAVRRIEALHASATVSGNRIAVAVSAQEAVLLALAEERVPVLAVTMAREGLGYPPLRAAAGAGRGA